MKKIFALTAVLALSAALLTGCAHGNRTEEMTGHPGVVEGTVAVMTATVADIDRQKRIITPQNQEGDLRDIYVGEEAVNLPQVKAGDIVTVKFYESVAVEVINRETPAAAGEKTTINRAKPGEMPGGMISHQITLTATVKSIDMEAASISLMGPAGKTVKVRVADPANLEKVRVGDELLVTFTEARAISVERAGK